MTRRARLGLRAACALGLLLAGAPLRAESPPVRAGQGAKTDQGQAEDTAPTAAELQTAGTQSVGYLKPPSAPIERPPLEPEGR